MTPDTNDQLGSDSYDANGSTTVSGAKTYVYDFENHIIAVNPGGPNQISLAYNGDGQRVSKTVNGVTTKYLVDDNNPTGYAQVVEELTNGGVRQVYTYGAILISQAQFIGSSWTTSFYGSDGHGSIRFLTSSSGSVTDTYDYDAFGVSIHQTGSTPNVYLYSGEQFDPDLGLYYQRARYLNVSNGRFMSMDGYEGINGDPSSLHKYLYATGNPVDNSDPTGKFSIAEQVFVYATLASLVSILGATLARALGYDKLGNRLEGAGRIFNGIAFIAGAARFAVVNPLILGNAILAGADEIIVGTEIAWTGELKPSPIQQFLVSAGLPAEWANLSVGIWKLATAIGPNTVRLIRSIKDVAVNFRSAFSGAGKKAIDSFFAEYGKVLVKDEVWNQIKGLDPIERGRWLLSNFSFAHYDIWANLSLGIKGGKISTGPTPAAYVFLDLLRMGQNLYYNIFERQ